MLETSGVEVYDLGKDVSSLKFVERAVEVNADVIGLSILMSTTMGGMQTVIDNQTKCYGEALCQFLPKKIALLLLGIDVSRPSNRSDNSTVWQLELCSFYGT